ncbi:hypothetical protein [Actinomadura sp. 7K534]|uniref:hypothetical protein n=1 Tax=Actinomadura sp. 7K534 TaxID=2530366 RepID=UPI001044DE88|nr:hypothetical protein [Actinomadura sp. 7K534]TDB97515.1 hypothetical protein E1266_06195 [Actinomadura sp. 7K534]
MGTNGDAGEPEGAEGRIVSPDTRARPSEGPDVHLDVPLLKVEEISLEVENLEAHVSLVAQVLDMLRLNVGADVTLGRVKLEIKGVEAQALLDVRLDNVAIIVDRVLTTLDRNPELLQHIGRGVEAAVGEVGAGAGKAVGEVGEGAGSAVKDVGEGAGGAVKDVGEGAGGAVKDIGAGTGGAVKDVGEGAGGAVKDVGEGAGGAVKDVGEGTGGAVKGVGEGAGGAAEKVGEGAGGAVKDVGEGAGGAVKDVGEGTGSAAENVGETASDTAKGLTGDTASDQDSTASDQDNTASDQNNTASAQKDAPAQGGNGGDTEQPAANGEQEITALQTALQETEQSVRELGRALVRMIAPQPRPPSGGGNEGS